MATSRPKPTSQDVIDTVARDLAIDWLLQRAYRYGEFAHARANIEAAGLPPEVTEVLVRATERAAG